VGQSSTARKFLSSIKLSHHHFIANPMSSSKCAIRHARSPIDSLCKVFGIPNKIQRPAHRTFSQYNQSNLQRNGLHRINQQSRLRSSTPIATKNGFSLSIRSFSATRPTFAFKPSSKTMEQLRSRGRLGVLKFSPGQALFRGASLHLC